MSGISKRVPAPNSMDREYGLFRGDIGAWTGHPWNFTRSRMLDLFYSSVCSLGFLPSFPYLGISLFTRQRGNIDTPRFVLSCPLFTREFSAYSQVKKLTRKCAFPCTLFPEPLLHKSSTPSNQMQDPLATAPKMDHRLQKLNSLYRADPSAMSNFFICARNLCFYFYSGEFYQWHVKTRVNPRNIIFAVYLFASHILYYFIDSWSP